MISEYLFEKRTDGSVTLHFTLWRHEEGRAVALHQRLGSVDQGQPVGDGVLMKAIR